MRGTRFILLLSVSAASLPGFLAGGCGMELETGYKYRPLNATPVQRRGYYASPYSQEKAAAEQENKQGVHPASGGP
jgi:hypothetical protein